MVLGLPRWPVLAPIIASRDPRLQWSATNLSEGGFFAAGGPLLPVRSTLEVDLVLPGAFGPSLELCCRVQVVWARHPREERADRPCGMGMRFLDLRPSDLHDLRKYIDELARSQGDELEEIEVLEVLDDEDGSW